MTGTFDHGRLLLIEDDEVFAELTTVILVARGYAADDLVVAATMGDAEARLHACAFDLILADLALPDAQGLDVVRQCRAICGDVPIIVLTACRDTELAIDALSEGAQDYLNKGEFDDEQLMRSIRYARARALCDAELRATNARLEESNAQLEQYATIASHDLRSPVRTARVLAGRMMAPSDGDGPSVAALAGTLDGCLARLETMLEGLLDYAQARDLLASGDVVDERLTTLVAETLADLDAELQAAGAQVDVVSDPVLRGHPVLLRSVMRNLIQNAVKYRSERPLRVVVDAAGTDGGRVLVRVLDNGVGIEPRFRSRVFAMFEQLNARNEGIGLGLTQCHRIVSLHGGEISIGDGLDGIGTGVSFTLPVGLNTTADPVLIVATRR